MRVLIAEHQSKVRFALRVTLEREPGLSGVTEVADAGELVSQAKAMRPDLVLVDWELPDLDCAETLPALRRACPRLFILVLSSKAEGCQAALRAGADVSISKADSPDRLLSAIREYSIRSRNWDAVRVTGNSDPRS